MSDDRQREIEDLEEESDFHYTRTEVLLYLLCDELPALRLEQIVHRASNLSHEQFEEDSRGTGLRDFVGHLVLDLMQVRSRREKEDLEE